MSAKDLTLNVQVTLTGKQIDKLTKEPAAKTGKTIVEILSDVATGLLIDQADNGLMIDPATASRLCEITGKEIERPTDLIPLVEKAVGKKDGGIVVETVLDPFWVGPLQELATQQGRSLNELLSDCLNLIMDKGWLYEINPGPKTLNFTQQDMKYLRESLGKEVVSGTDVAQFIREMFDSPVAAR